jgi:hypothetical protein
MTTFKTLVNNLFTTLGAAYTAGSGTMTVAAGTGAQFGTVTASAPVRFTLITAASYGSSAEVLTIYQATGISGDVLSGVSAIEGTVDQNYFVGDKVEARPTQGSYSDIHSAINAIETDATIVRASGVYANPSWLTSISGSVVSGNISGNAGGLSTNISESQVTNLVSDLAAKAADQTVVHLAGAETISGAKTFSTAPVLGTLSGLVKASSGVVSTAVAGTDYVAPSGSITGTANNVTGTVAIVHGGTGQTTAAAGFNALSPITTLGDLIYGSGPNSASRLAGNTTPSKAFLVQTGTGSGSGAPTWGAIAAADIPTFGAAGSSHAAGAAPDPGPAAHATPYLLGDDGSFHQVTGSGLDYSGGIYTFPGGSPGGTNSQIQFNQSGEFAGAANWSIGAAGQLNAASMSAPGSPSIGDIWWDAIRQTPANCVSGVTAYQGGTLIWITSPGPSVAGSSTASSLLNGAGVSGTLTLPANFFVPNRGLQFHFWGTFTTGGTLATVPMVFKLGATMILRTYQSGFGTNCTSQAWECQGTIYCKSTGTSGTFNGAGRRTSYLNASSESTGTLGTLTPGTDVTLDTTVPQTIDFAFWTSATPTSCRLTGGRIALLS